MLRDSAFFRAVTLRGRLQRLSSFRYCRLSVRAPGLLFFFFLRLLMPPDIYVCYASPIIFAADIVAQVFAYAAILRHELICLYAAATLRCFATRPPALPSLSAAMMFRFRPLTARAWLRLTACYARLIRQRRRPQR